MKVTKILVTIIAETDDGHEGVVGSYLADITEEEAERMECHALSTARRLVANKGKIDELEIYNVAAYNVVLYWSLLSTQLCERFVKERQCESGHGEVDTDIDLDAGNDLDPAIWSDIASLVKDIPDCKGKCEDCPLWNDATDECQIGKIPPSDQSKLDNFLKS